MTWGRTACQPSGMTGEMSPCHARAVQRVGAFINRLVHAHAFQQVEDKNKKNKIRCNKTSILGVNQL
ncbi:hypothetical protein [Acetobacterium wieringae]|uniref:hypothetical protein n=1 Tax=Acetobacterium wieringae TaxID=52694 RepID=UPI0026EF1B9F|nr:hypothetical protein [Acetobacterium wieringae]